MRWLPALFSLSLLAGGSLAARKSSEDRFSEYHAKSLSSTPVKLGDASYKKLTSAPRDYSVAVLLTALEARFACHLCTEFQPEWELLSNSWTKGDKAGDSRLLFGTLDFSDGRDIFLGVRHFPTRWAYSQESALLIPGYSSVYKLPRSSSFSSPPLALTPGRLQSLFDMTLQTG